VAATDSDSHWPKCEVAEDECICKAEPLNTGDGTARVRRENKGRGGKTVTTIQGLLLTADELRKLTGELKRRCGCGGSVKDGVIEIQGSQVDEMIEELRKRGFKAMQAGESDCGKGRGIAQ